MYRCNYCAVGNCKGADGVAGCNLYKPHPPYKEPLIMQLAAKQPQELHDLLSSLDLRVQPLADPPYFKIMHGKEVF